MIDFNGWFGRLTGTQAPEDDDPVSRTLRLLGGGETATPEPSPPPPAQLWSGFQYPAEDLDAPSAARMAPPPIPTADEESRARTRGIVSGIGDALSSVASWGTERPDVDPAVVEAARRRRAEGGVLGPFRGLAPQLLGEPERQDISTREQAGLERMGEQAEAHRAGVQATLGPYVDVIPGAIRGAATAFEEATGRPGSVYQAAQDVSGVLGPDRIVGPLARVAGTLPSDRALATIARPVIETVAPIGRAAGAVIGAGRSAVSGLVDHLGRPLAGAADDAGQVVELGGGFVPRASRPSGVVEAAAAGERGAEAARYADELEAAGRPQSSIKRWRSLASVDVANKDELAREVEVFPLVSPEATREMLGDRPEYLEAVVRFGLEQRRKLLAGQMTERDVAKAYGMTLMSMRSAAQDAEALQTKLARGFVTGEGEVIPPNPELANLGGLVNVHNGAPLGDIFTETAENGRRIVRPESAGAAWYWTDDGQRAINSIEEGEFIPELWDGLRRTRRAFGSDTVGGNGALRPLTPQEVARGDVNLTNLSGWVQEMNEGIARLRAQGRESEIGDWLTEHARRLKGIGVGKSAFIKQLLGMGDAATIDAREINYWLSGTGLLTPSDTSRGANLARAVSQWWGSAPEVSRVLEPRIQAAIADLGQRYPELVEGVHPEAAGGFLHHWIWDKAGGSETAHRDLMATQQLAAGFSDALGPGFRPAAYNAAQGGFVGGGSEVLQAEAEGRDTDPAEMARRGLVGAGLGIAAGRAASRRPGLAGSGAVPRSAASPTISPLGQRVMDTYRAVTPRRAEAATSRSIQIASDAIAGKRPPSGGMQALPQAFVTDVHDAIVRNLGSTKIVATGLRPGALQAYLRGEGLTSKVDTRDLAKINEITQGQVNVAGGRAGRPYTIAEAADFAQRESEQMRVAVGGTRFPDPETGAIDEEAPRVLYGYVSEGQPLVGPNRPTLWLVWDDDTPRITSAHHPYGLTSPGQDIHASMPPGLKAAIWAEDTVAGGRAVPAILDQGGNLVEAAPGVPGTSPLVRGWEERGVDVGGGRRIAETNWLVGPEGEDAMRANGLILGMPRQIQQAIASGRMSDPEQVAAVLMRGGSPKWKGGWGAVMNPSRSESLIVDPDISHIKAIYITGTPKDLASNLTGGGTTGPKITQLDLARRLRADVRQATEGQKDIPILFNDITQGAASAAQVKAGASNAGWAPTLISDAQVLEGPPLTLSPGRGEVVERYTQEIDPSTGAPYMNLGAGFVPAGGQPHPLRRQAAGAAAPQTAPGPSTSALLRRIPGLRSAFDGAAARAASLAAGDVTAPSVYDWLKQALYSGIYGPATAVSATVGGLQEATLGNLKEGVRALVSGRPGDYGRQVGAQLRTAPEALAGLGRVLAGETSASTAASSGGSQGTANLSERIVNPLGHAAARLLERPGEILTEAPDAVFRPAFIAQGMRREADRIAAELGLRGDRATSYADSLMQTAETLRANPGARSTSAEAQRVVDAGAAYADELGYKGDPGGFGRWLGQAAKRDDLIGVLATLLVPFPSMAARMTTAALRSTPIVGLAPGLRRAGDTRFDVVYDQAFGTAAAAGMAYWAMQGGITGSGPADAEKRAMLAAQGWQPKSTLVGGVYVPNRAFGRFQPLLDAAGEVHDALAYAEPGRSPGQAAGDLMKRASGVALDQTGLSGLADIHDMLGESFESAFPGFAARTTVRAVPFGGVLRAAASALDPTQRRPERWSEQTGFGTAYGQQLAQAVPGLRQSVPAAQDVLGRGIENPQVGLGAFAPRATSRRDDPVIGAYQRAGIDISKPPSGFTVDGVTIAMTPEQQRAYQRIMGQYLTDRIDTIEGVSDTRRVAALRRLYQRARAEAARQIQQEIGRSEIRARVRAEKEKPNYGLASA